MLYPGNHPSGAAMDFVYLSGCAVLFVAMLAMVIGCDALGTRP
jgi:hypothetical protein